MSKRKVTFKVESNKAKNSFWYTLVAGNGNTVMTSKAKYVEKATAKRAAKNAIKLFRSNPELVLEFTDASGRVVQEAG